MRPALPRRSRPAGIHRSPVRYRYLQHQRSLLADELPLSCPGAISPFSERRRFGRVSDQRHAMTLFNEEALTDAQRMNRVLRAASDHYPRMVALQFGLQQSGTDFSPVETAPGLRQSSVSAEERVQIFQTEVRHHFNLHLQTRMAAGKLSPPTLLRWIWERNGALPCRMMLLFNLSTCHHPRQETATCEAALNAVASLLRETWHDTCPDGELTGMKFFLVERTSPELSDGQYAVLQKAMRQLVCPISTASCDLAG